MISERSLHLSALPGLPSVPRIERLVWERAASPGYRHRSQRASGVYAAVQITLAGSGAVFTETGAIANTLPRGRALVFLTERHQVIYGHPGGTMPWDFLYTNLVGSVAETIVADLVAAQGHVLAIDPDHAVVRALLAMIPHRVSAQRDIALAEHARLAFDLLAVLIEANQPIVDAEARLLRSAVGFLRAHLDRDVDVAAVAAHCGVSREHLSRCFRAAYGEGPATWVRRQRIAQAERLLAAGTLSVAAVAQRCGFANASHFAQVFRRQHGCAPRDYRD